MQQVDLTVNDLQAIMKFVEAMQALSVDIRVDNSSGIGQVVTATVHAEINGYSGELTVGFTDYNTW